MCPNNRGLYASIYGNTFNQLSYIYLLLVIFVNINSDIFLSLPLFQFVSDWSMLIKLVQKAILWIINLVIKKTNVVLNFLLVHCLNLDHNNTVV